MRRFERALLRQTWLTALLFAALLSRALIPLGFMPSASGVVLCVGYAPTADAAALEHSLRHAERGGSSGSPAQGSPDHDQGPCPFAAAASLGPLPSLPFVPLSQPPASQIAAPSLAVFRGLRLSAHLPRGPPRSV